MTVRAIEPRLMPSLTGIRGVAALWVVFFHIQNAAGAMGIPALAGLPIIKDGFRGPDLFFLLSGFVMMHVHQRDFLRMETRDLLRFAALRVVRVYPLALVVLLLILLTVLLLPGFVVWYRALGPYYADSFSVPGFVQTALLANRWFMPDFGQWNEPIWSLSIEIIAYATFPFLALMAARAKSELLLLVVGLGLLGALIAFLAVTHNLGANLIGQSSIVRAMTCFPAGVALYRVGALTPAADSGSRWSASLALASTASLLVILLIPRAAVLAPLCFAGIIMGVRFGYGVINTLLCSRIVIFLGEISFALYLVHLVPLNLLLWTVQRHSITPPETLLALAAYLAVIILISYILHERVELPAQRYGRRLIAQRFARPVPPSALEQIEQPLMGPPRGRGQ